MNEHTDEQLVRDCLQGREDAWVALIHRYRQMVYAVIRSYHLSDADAGDVFQAICLELYNYLPKLRDAGSLRRWLITVSSHQSLQWKTAHRGNPGDSEVDLDSFPGTPEAQTPGEVERAQMLVEAMESLPRRCREMIRLLFFEDPPLPYSDLATRLGLAVGSIGFIRRRCLNKLRTALESLGFRI